MPRAKPNAFFTAATRTSPQAILALLLLAACSGPVSTTVPLRQSVAQSRPDLVYVLENCSRRSQTCPKAGGFVQILGGRTITNGLANPTSIAVAPAGEVYVGNYVTKESGSVTIYGAGKATPQSTIAHVKGTPDEISFDGSGHAYVASQYVFQCCQLRSRVAMYLPGSSRPVHVLRDVGALAGAPVFDASGHLYVQNFAVFPGWIAVYAPGKLKPSRILRSGVGFPERLAVRPDGTLFVLNRKFDHSSDVLVFAPGSVTPERTIVAGFDRALSIALDPAGNLYVANVGRRRHDGNVSVYAAGSSSVTRVIRKGIDRPVDLTVDAAGRLLVLNAPGHAVNTVTVYAGGASSPVQTYRLAQSARALAVQL